MYHFPINYDEPLFRPPSEAYSLIIQITLGCSYNKCSFCEMYTSKQFKARKEEDIYKDIEAFIPYRDQIRKVFLGDGDPLVLSTERLLRILTKLRNTFPKLQRVSTYATTTNVIRKSIQELNELKNAGLDLLYIGIESGDDEVLYNMQKGETFKTIVEGINKATETRINSSVMIINGAGGKLLSKQHAINSARVLNETQPKYASTLVLTMYKGMEHFKNRYLGDYISMNLPELISEMQIFMEHLNLNETIFRSDHASNYLVLKGILGKDQSLFLQQIDTALNHPDIANLRSEQQRGF